MTDVNSNSPTVRSVVAVLLATHNGQPWIARQVASILEQQDVAVRLVVSDDMSIDGTWEWLEALAKHEERVVLLPRGARFGGAAKNFFRLFRDADLDRVDAVALADQDDIWLPGKLARAMALLHERHADVCSGNVTAFWPDGRRVLINKAQAQRRYDYLFEAAGPGCTYVLKRDVAEAFREFLRDRWGEANDVSLHDWLVYAWARARRVPWHIDCEPMLEYRQHQSNQFGANEGLSALRTRLRMLRSGWYREEIRKIVRLVAHIDRTVPASLAASGHVPRLFLIRNMGQVRRRMRDRLFFFITVMLGIY